MPQLTFARLMSVVLGVIGLFTAIKFVMAVGAAYTDYRNVSRMATASSLVTAWERGTVALSLERSVMQVALAVETPVSADLRGLIDAQRAQAEADFREALDLSSSDALKELHGPFSEAAQKSFGAIGGLRTEVDAMLAVPKAARDPKRIYNLPLEMKGEISGMKNASALVSPENSVSSNLSIGLTAIQNRAWEVREFGGRARTYFAIAVLNRTAISENELGAVLADSQRAAAAWQAIRYVGEANTLPQNLVEQIDIGNRLYFDDYIALTETLIAASQRATSETVDYPIEFPEFFATSNEALDHMTALSQLSGEELLQYWMQRQDSALLQLAVNAVLAAIVISIIGCFIWLLNRRVIMRLETTTSALEKLSSGTLDVVISRKPNDLMEIGRLTDALENFRTSLTEAEEAKARAARQSADARTAVMTQMKKEFGSAVDMAVQGDFSARVVASFEEQEIAELASGINRLMSFLDENIAATNDLMQRVAEGNFTGRLEGEFPGALGDLQKSINMTLDRLSQLVREIATAGESMRLTVDGIEDVAERLAESATKQAASVEETSATIEQFSASIRSNAQDSTQAATLANQSTARANSGSGIVENTVSAMEEIQSGSQKVKEIVSVIDGISFQTNLLALNAAVESARAGEAGKGFSVVASEVRGLAQRSASAASDIRELIDTTVASVDSGVDLASQTGSSFAEIMTSISELEGAVSSIVDTNSRQSSSIEEINSAVRKIDKITQDTAGMAARSSSTAKKLSEDTQKLLSLIAFFKVRDDAADPSRLAG